jgi:ornithine cyclodeaminase
MPGLIGESLFGLKLIANKVDGNTLTTTAMVLVLDAASLEPRGLLSADYLTDYRSAAGFAAATQVLARADAGTHTVYGAGKLSLPTILLVSHVRPVKRVILVSRTQSRVDRLKETLESMPAFHGCAIETGLPPAEAAAQADIISTVTTSSTPVFKGAGVRPGTHINLGGAFHRDAREVDDRVAARAVFFVDAMDSCLVRAGDIVQPLESGMISRDQIKGEIGAVLNGDIEGRLNPEEITVFKSLGNAAQDLTLAERLIDRAVGSGQGVTFDPWGS